MTHHTSENRTGGAVDSLTLRYVRERHDYPSAYGCLASTVISVLEGHSTVERLGQVLAELEHALGDEDLTGRLANWGDR